MMHPPRQSPGGCSLASASSESHERKISIAPKLRCHYAYQKRKSEVSNKHIKYMYAYYRGRTVPCFSKVDLDLPRDSCIKPTLLLVMVYNTLLRRMVQ